MPKYISKYVPCELAVARIAKHFHRGDELAARWEDLAPAITEGAITERPLEDLHTKRRAPDDMLSHIVGGTVLAKGNQPVDEDNQELKNWPEGTWLRRELEKIYGEIFAEDGGSTTPDEQDEARQAVGEQGRPSRRDQQKQETAARYDRWYDRSQKIKAGNKSLTPIGICRLVAKEEKAAGYREVTVGTIKRRLNEDRSGWAD